jgi:DNA polymerase-3 subunit delta
MLADLLNGPPLEGFLVVEAGSLKADDPLRILFEKSEATVAIACYPDEARDLDALVSEVLTAHKQAISPEARRLLVARLGADRSLSRNELEKLALFAMGSGTITEDDVDAVIGDASEMAIDTIIGAAAAGRSTAAILECDRVLASGESAQTVIILTQRYFQRLHRIRSAVDSGASLDSVLRTLRPPVPFKLKAEISAQVRDWSLPKLTRALARISDAQRSARGGIFPEDLVTEQLLLDLARLAAVRLR